ncbi:hypothetical protein Sarmat_00892 [Rickettsiales endosymbiont of Paramecium tredecaurelia]|uniref:hypothetical protein n=1 Tax=Candidatus Sarmatiella mevalonica TaxID=2770581 RepID=UPI001922CEFE|nr:hypothetical protein [Candidatus Sarmatiella mevalonica]MBL3285028.1 hypothetical protein [Candidatus Sarmatiella mevalonica]
MTPAELLHAIDQIPNHEIKERVKHYAGLAAGYYLSLDWLDVGDASPEQKEFLDAYSDLYTMAMEKKIISRWQDPKSINASLAKTIPADLTYIYYTAYVLGVLLDQNDIKPRPGLLFAGREKTGELVPEKIAYAIRLLAQEDRTKIIKNVRIINPKYLEESLGGYIAFTTDHDYGIQHYSEQERGEEYLKKFREEAKRYFHYDSDFAQEGEILFNILRYCTKRAAKDIRSILTQADMCRMQIFIQSVLPNRFASDEYTAE